MTRMDAAAVASDVVLEYPNGRQFATVVALKIELGVEFDLYGRRWRVVGPGFDRWGKPNRDDSPNLCRSVGTLIQASKT